MSDRERYESALKRLDEISAAVRLRMKDKDWMWLQLKPTESDWYEGTESAETHECKLAVMELEPKLMGDPSERLRVKRELRRLGVAFDRRAYMEDLQAALVG